MKSVEDQEKERKEAIRTVLSFVVAVGFVVVAIGFGLTMFIIRDKVPQENVERPVPGVQVQALEGGKVTPELTSEGMVESRREVKLAAEVGGRVTWISPQLIAGGRVDAAEVLVKIEDADLKAVLERAKSALADAELAQEVEGARGEQARRDWERIGRGEPSALTLRKPQLESAKDRVASAAADVEKAERDVERAEIRAPFAGRVRSASVEVGAVLAPGSAVAEVYSDRELEVRLPFSLRDYGFIDPENTPRFTVTAQIGAGEKSWPAELARLGGEVDRSTLTAEVFAKVLPNENGELPPPGIFVEASFPGTPVEDAYEIPRKAVRGLNEVWVVRGSKLARLEVTEVRGSRETVLVRGDFEPGDQLLLTRMTAPVEGMEVRVVTGEEEE